MKDNNKISIPWPDRDPTNTEIDLEPLEIEDPGQIVYFVGASDGSKVKIGWSKNSQKDLRRILQFKGVWTDGDPVLLAVLRGTRDNEQSILRYFREHLVNGQLETVWTDAILPYLVWLRDQPWVSISFEEFITPRGQMAVDSNIEVLGEIDLDPATHVYANEKIKAKRIYTKAQNGRTLEWNGRVYLNPPFSEWDIWLKKAIEEIVSGRIESIIILGFTRTLTAHYFTALLEIVNALCIKKGRIAFWGHKSKSKSAPDGLILLYWGSDVQRFVRVMKDLGTVWLAASGE